MKKICAVLLIITLTFSFLFSADARENQYEMNDPKLLSYMEGTVYESMISSLSDAGYYIENIDAVYISQEYLDEVAFNSQANIYFGYNLEELNEQFQGTRYIFTLGEDHETTVRAFESYDDSFDKALGNIAFGTGVILLCVTVSAVTGGSAPAISLIFAAAAKTGTIGALEAGGIGGLLSGIITGIKTGDVQEALKAAVVNGSEGFKWGAFGGALSGGAAKAIALKGAAANGLTMNQVAAIQKESKYPLDVIKNFKNMEQYQICRDAGLVPKMVNGKTALVRKIDLNFVDEFGRTNLDRMKQGLSALDPNGSAYELHHIGQKMDSTLSILTKTEHMQGGNNAIWHDFSKASEIDRKIFGKQREEFWKNMASLLTEGKI